MKTCFQGLTRLDTDKQNFATLYPSYRLDTDQEVLYNLRTKQNKAFIRHTNCDLHHFVA